MSHAVKLQCNAYICYRKVRLKPVVEAYVHILQCSYQVMINLHWLQYEPSIKEMLLRRTAGYTWATKQEKKMKTMAFKPVGLRVPVQDDYLTVSTIN